MQSMSVYTVHYRDLVYTQQNYGKFSYIFETSRARADPNKNCWPCPWTVYTSLLEEEHGTYVPIDPIEQQGAS
jgi:hypothetical protein